MNISIYVRGGAGVRLCASCAGARLPVRLFIDVVRLYIDLHIDIGE